MSYENKCGSCGYYEFEGDGYKGYCSYYKSYYYPGDSCEHHTNLQSSSCYITTIICDILNFEDNCNVLNNLRSFRNNIMQKDIKYLPILLEYDVVGPQIAKAIKETYKKEQDKELWIQFYNFYLSPTSNLVTEGKYEEAVERYKEIVAALKEYFSISDINIEQVKIDYDMQQGGHGIVKKLQQKNSSL